ncbi:hypothetical protein N7457_004946 [Penicillium paradoxum]|uniref:uncharacterized protein n=1 Tax=Penicillium paradoxum TaxID=176176 RepID=UPI002549B10B|nr:uncharacterized protein N7457_004946 [Penicillium paradoxum]KAJ5783172.1 hypothetical protein N7457_004946 [Penicillium paradoxum]
MSFSNHPLQIQHGEHPIGDGLNSFRATFTSICEDADLRSPDEAIDRLKREAYFHSGLKDSILDSHLQNPILSVDRHAQKSYKT